MDIWILWYDIENAKVDSKIYQPLKTFTSHFLSSNRLFYFLRKEETKRCTAKLRWMEEMHFKQAHQLNVADINLWENTSLSDCFSRNSLWRCFFFFFLFMSRRVVQFHPPIELVNIDTNGRRDPLLSKSIGLLVKCPSETGRLAIQSALWSLTQIATFIYLPLWLAG